MKIGVIGAGAVGSSTAFCLVMQDIANEVILIDRNESKARAEALDISHAAPFSRNNIIKSGNYEDLNSADIVVVTAGATMIKGETRIDLLEKNTKIFQNIIPQVAKNAPNSIILIATNPVDVMVDVTLKLSGFDKDKVIGSGTVLDSSRFKTALSNHFGLSPQSIHSYVLGEHGDSEVLAWSTSTIANADLETIGKQSNKLITAEKKEEIENYTKFSGYDIFNDKGNTCYGIAGALSRICRAIKDNELATLCVSSLQQDVEGIKDVCLSLPSVIGKNGVEQIFMPKLTTEEKASLKNSAEKLKELSMQAINIISK